MKKIFSILLTAAVVLGFFASCSDIPSPYELAKVEGNGKTLPYKSANLNSGWTLIGVTADQPWLQSSNFTQATGYQDWDGTGTKSNKEVEGYLVSPAFNTKSASGKVKISFDLTLRYTDRVSNWKNNHKLYVSKSYVGGEFDPDAWEQLDYTPQASTYSDWTLYPSGDIQIPEDFVNQENVRFAFYFYAPASASTTWELENFLIQEGEANTDGGEDEPVQPGGDSSKESPYTVAEAQAVGSGTAYVKGYIVGYVNGTKLDGGAAFEIPAEAQTEIVIADSPRETETSKLFPVQLPVGDLREMLDLYKHNDNMHQEVIVYGSLETYFGVLGMKTTSWARIFDREIGKDPEAPEVPMPDAVGDGTETAPYNVPAAIKLASSLPADQNSDKVYVKGVVSKIQSIDTGQYGNATYYISVDGTSNHDFQVYRGYALGNKHFTSESELNVGDEVIIYGSVVNYKGNIPEMAQGNYIVSQNGKTASDDPTTGGDENASGKVDIEGAFVTLLEDGDAMPVDECEITLAELGFENGAAVDEVTMRDGTVIKFGAGSNSNAPKYYEATAGIRVYANNTITFTSTRHICRIEMYCDSYNGKDYPGNATATVSFEGNKVVYTNAAPDAGTQLRVKRIIVCYSERMNDSKKRKK